MKYIFPIFISVFSFGCMEEYKEKLNENSDDEWYAEEFDEEYILFSTDKETKLIEKTTREIFKSWKSSDEVIISAFTDKDAFTYFSEYNPMLYRGVETNKSTFGQDGSFDKIQLLNWGGELIWEYQISPSNYSFHGEIIPLDNGNILLQGWERVDNVELHKLGRLHALLPEGGYTMMERVIEIHPNLVTGSTDVVWEWNLKDHVVQDKFNHSTDTNYIQDLQLSKELDLNHHNITSGLDWAGTDAMAYDYEKDNIIFYFRHFDSIAIMNRNTKKMVSREVIDDRVLALDWKDGDLIALIGLSETNLSIEEIEIEFSEGEYIENTLTRNREVLIPNMSEDSSFSFDYESSGKYILVDKFKDTIWKIENASKIWELEDNSSEVYNAKHYWGVDLGLY
jgi:hypothetical protein